MRAISRLEFEDCVIYVMDEEQGDLVQAAAFGPKNPTARELLNPVRFALGRGIVVNGGTRATASITGLVSR